VNDLRCPECGATEFQVTFKEDVLWPLVFREGEEEEWVWGRAEVCGYDMGKVMFVQCGQCEYEFDLTKELEEFILKKADGG